MCLSTHPEVTHTHFHHFTPVVTTRTNTGSHSTDCILCFRLGVSKRQTTDCLLHLLTGGYQKKKVPLSLRGNTEHNTGPQSNLSSRVLILVQPQDLRGLTCPMRLLYREAYFERSCYDFCRLTMKTSFCRQNLFCAQYGLCRVTELSNGWLWFPWRRSMFTLLSSTEFSGKLRNLEDAKRRIRRRSFP